jgi:hypothetical protein
MAPRKSPRAAQAKVPPMTESLMFPRKFNAGEKMHRRAGVKMHHAGTP